MCNTALGASSFVRINQRCAACKQSSSNETKYWDPVSVFVKKSPHTSECSNSYGVETFEVHDFRIVLTILAFVHGEQSKVRSFLGSRGKLVTCLQSVVNAEV